MSFISISELENKNALRLTSWAWVSCLYQKLEVRPLCRRLRSPVESLQEDFIRNERNIHRGSRLGLRDHNPVPERRVAVFLEVDEHRV